MRYIELNPVRAGMVEVPSEYKWSSYHANAYGRDEDCIKPHPVYIDLSVNEEERLVKYRELFSDSLGYEQLHDIREAVNQELILGKSFFKEKIEIMTKRRVEPLKAGRPKVRELDGCYYVY